MAAGRAASVLLRPRLLVCMRRWLRPQLGGDAHGGRAHGSQGR